MTVTNKHGLPEVLVRAVQFDPGSKEDRGDISVTGLLSPPRLVTLRKRHYRDITEDVSERIWALFGQIGHGILERAAEGGLKVVVEQRFAIYRLGWKVTGRLDRAEDKDGWATLIDWKFPKTWALKYGAKDEWEKQLNLYALLAKENGIKVKALQNIVFLKDWERFKAEKDSDYPHADVIVLDYEPWPDEQAEEFLADRIVAHQLARKRLPECTAEERWERKGKWTRCERWCPVREFCQQWNEHRNGH